MKIIIKKQVLLELSGLGNPHQLALRSNVSYPTVNKYVNNTESVDAIDAEVLCSILLNGVGLSKEQILEMKIGDLFEIL